MTLHERMGFMIFSLKISNLITYMVDAGVDRDFAISFADYIEYLLEHGVHYEEIMMNRLPPFPPYSRFLFETRKDADNFCKVVKSWYGLDYQSKLTKRKRWRLIHVRVEGIPV